MTTYNAAAVSDTAIAHKKGISLQQGRALRDNPISMQEGGSGSPYDLRQWHPYDSTAVGDGNDGTIYDFSIDGAVTDIVSPTFEDGWSYGFVFYGLTGGNLNVYVRRATGGTWAGPSQILDNLTYGANGGPLVIRRPYVAANYADISIVGGIWAVGGGTSRSAAPYTDLTPIYSTTSTKFDAIRFETTSGTFTAGTVKMLRRKDYW